MNEKGVGKEANVLDITLYSFNIYKIKLSCAIVHRN